MKTLQALNKLCLNHILTGGVLVAALVAQSAFAASQTWTNAPVDNTWTNVLNWNGKAVPGALNSSTVGDIATFTNPIPVSGIGGAGNPITNDATRAVGGLVFDTATCGAYVFGNSLNDNYLDLPISTTTNHWIVINPPVTSPIKFNQAVRFRFPSSTNGRYDLTNNATAAGSTLFFAAMTNTSSSTRPLSLFLNGSNTGTNTIAHIDDSAGGIAGAEGAILIFKEGAGRWILSGPNDLPQKTSASVVAGVFVQGGTLEVKDPASLGSITVANLQVTNATLQIDGVTLNNGGITLQKNGVIQMNGGGTVNGITLSTVSGNTATLATTSPTDVMTVGTAANALSGGAADTVLHVAGPGTVFFGQSTAYAGKWSLDAGTNQLGNASGLGTGANLNIAAGATLDVSPITTGSGTYALSTAAISAGGTGTTVGSTAATINADPSGTVNLATGSKAITLTFTPTSFSGDTTHPALYVSQGTLSLGGNAFTVNNASGTPLGAGTYLLIQQASGSIASSGGYAVSVTGSGMASGAVGSIQVTGGQVNLVVTLYASQNLIWTGGAANANWDVATDANWLDGASPSVFNNSDIVTFNSVGSTNPTVNLSGTLAPGSVTVDTSGNNYTFAGSGVIAGSTSLTKLSPGTLLIQAVNTYSGGTVISNGVIQLGVNNAIPSTGAGDVAIYNTGILDLNGFSTTINALTGNGTVDDVSGGGASVLTVGNNNDNGVFSGVLQNTSGTLGLTKAGNGVETLTASNTYSGPTTVNAGTLSVKNYSALGVSAVTVNAGTLDLQTNLVIGTLGGTGGLIANNYTSTTNTLVITNTSTFGGVIADGSGGAGIKVLVTSGTLRLNAANTYSGGTTVSSGAGLAIGGGAANAGAGGVIASNNVTISQPNTGSSSSAPGNAITTVDGATVTFTSGTTANNYGGQFNGSTLATNIFANGNMSIGGAYSFSNFLGTVIITNGEIRFGPGTGFFGGDNTTFNFVNGGGCYTRDAGTVRLGALTGNGVITAPSNPTATYWIGAKGISSVFSGSISGSNNIVKTGVGTLTLRSDQIAGSVGIDGNGNIYTNYYYTNGSVICAGSTTISNGVLALVVPVVLTNSYSGAVPTPITLASTTAVLDGSQMGYISNQYDSDGVTITNQSLVTNGVFEVASSQSLTGIGTIRSAKVLLDPGSTFSVGLPLGSLTATNNVELAGVVNMSINSTNTSKNSALLASSFTVDGTATLVVTNGGPTSAASLQGAVFQLFNHPVSGFASVTLPTLTSPFTLTNRLAIDGSIAVLGSLVSTNSFSITNVFSGGNISLSWPADHIGWRLQVQTNSIASGLGTNWSDWPGSTNVSSEVIPVNTANGAVFFRMIYP